MREGRSVFGVFRGAGNRLQLRAIRPAKIQVRGASSLAIRDQLAVVDFCGMSGEHQPALVGHFPAQVCRCLCPFLYRVEGLPARGTA